MKGKTRRILSLVLTFGLIFQQISFAQVAAELNLANYLSRFSGNIVQDKFRPLRLRYFSYDSLNDNFKVLLDKGDLKNLGAPELENSTKTLLGYFLVGVTLPDSMFWVNLRPDSEDRIIDPYLEKTDVGKIMLEADLQLKKDTALFTSPQTPEGKEYWDKLYKKAGEIFGNDNVTIPTLTRPWIVPGEIIVRESQDSAYVYKATLKVMLEQDYLKGSATYNFQDERSKALNEYSSQLIRELIIPKLTKEVNSSKRYAALRQVYYSLILSRWFKLRFTGKTGTYASLINTRDLTNLTSQDSWTKTNYFKQYQRSFTEGEYNIKEPVYTPTGQVIRSYFSGGINVASSAINTQNGIVLPNDNANKFGEVIGGKAVVDPQNINLKPVAVSSPTMSKGRVGLLAGFLLLQPGNIQGVPLQENVVTSASQANQKSIDKKTVDDLKTLASRGDTAAFDALVTLASQGDPRVFSYVSAQAMLGKPKAIEALQNLDITKLVQFASQGKDQNEICIFLGKLSSYGNTAAFNALVTLASQGNVGAMSTLYLAQDDREVLRILQNLDITKIVQLASQGNQGAIRCLIQLNGVNAEAKIVLQTFDITKAKLVQFASQGDREAARQLEYIADAGNAAAKRAIPNLDITKIVQLASQGNREAIGDAIWTLRELASSYGNAAAKKSLQNLDITKLVQLASQGSLGEIRQEQEIWNTIEVNIWTLEELASSYGNAAAKKSLQNLDITKLVQFASQGKEEAILILRRFASSYGNAAAEKALQTIKKSGSSPAEIQNQATRLGGIDFRALPMTIQSMGSFSGLNFKLPQLSQAELRQINVSLEMQQLKNMVQSGIVPSGQRIKGLIAACIQKKEMDSQVDSLLLCLADIFKLEEENASESSPELREALVIVDSQS